MSVQASLVCSFSAINLNIKLFQILSEHDLYTTTYSSSRLTNTGFAARCEGKDCLERFDPDSTAFLEIYYEQMSYEVLSEREAYSFVNFLSGPIFVKNQHINCCCL